MVLKDWSNCPSCKMCCNFSEMKRVLEADPLCPMCNTNVPAMNITISNDSQQEFKQLMDLMKDSGPQAGEDEEKEGSDDDKL